MKKLFVILYLTVILSPFFPASYGNNKHQKQCRIYIEQAKKALADKNYAEAVQLAKKAEEEAEKSKKWTEQASIRYKTQLEMSKAMSKYIWIKENRPKASLQEIVTKAETALKQSKISFDAADYKKAGIFAGQAIKLLSSIDSITSPENNKILNKEILPAYYKVRQWKKAKDCLWFIAALPGVYNNPFMWKKLYYANKEKFNKHKNPNFITKGTILVIPSLYGEKRKGLYDHSKQYKPLKKVKHKK